MSEKKQTFKSDTLAEAKRIMERLVNTPHKLHKDEPTHRAPKAKPKPRRPKQD
jgi:hypothetical protein